MYKTTNFDDDHSYDPDTGFVPKDTAKSIESHGMFSRSRQNPDKHEISNMGAIIFWRYIVEDAAWQGRYLSILSLYINFVGRKYQTGSFYMERCKHGMR